MTLACIMSAVGVTKSRLADQRFIIFGAGSAGLGIARQLRDGIVAIDGLSKDEANAKFFLVDRFGLIKRSLGAEKIREGIWHDPRLDCIAGNGVISELGVGDESFGRDDADAKPIVVSDRELVKGENGKEKEMGEEKEKETRADEKKQTPSDDLQAIDAMPIVILKGFDSKGGGAKREELLTVVSQEHEIKTLFGRKVAIDASMSIYQCLIAVRGQDGQVLTNEAGETTRCVRCLRALPPY